ncbi:MAG: tetratricopeptide repeat protein [Candidatus Omnitrophica bacterium]|nr:tetratricopeptide repeat protein [Candidatus Omnitrophota bacterium]
MKKFILCVVFSTCCIPVFAQASPPLDSKMKAQVYREQGIEMQARGDLEGALAHYRSALRLDPLYYEVYNDLGVVYESLGDDEKALAMYENGISLNPHYAPGYTNLALFYEKRGNSEKALEYWEKRYLLSEKEDYWWHQAEERLAQLPTYPELRTEWLKKKYGSFYENFTEKREQENLRKKEEAKGHIEKGMALMKEEEYDQAIGEFREAMVLKPPDEDIQTDSKIYYLHGQRLKTKKEIISQITEALRSVEANNYEVAVNRLKEALSAIFSIQN